VRTPDPSLQAQDDRIRVCRWCRKLLDGTQRRDAVYCGKRCRQAAHRFGRAVQLATAADRPLRLAYADPPYPGLSRRYYRDHPDYAGEVDHAELVSRLQAYDGWALSTSEEAVPLVMSLLAGVDGWRLGPWVRGSRGQRSAGPRSSWEAVFYRCARPLPADDWLDDSLVLTARPRLTDPDRVVGAKPAGFASWMFGLLGARRGDELDDMFPGSGGIQRAWALFQGSPDVGLDASREPGRDGSGRLRVSTTGQNRC